MSETERKNLRILVVEDDASIRETLGMVLEANEHEPVLVENGEKALEFLITSWPDVMLLDLTLPGMSGEQLYSTIQTRFNRVPPTVVLSAAQQGEARARFMPGTLFLAKPYTIDDLERIIQLISREPAA